MAKTALEQWDETAASNTDVGSVNIDEGCAPSGMNNAHREEMAQIAKWLGDDTLASASTTDLGSVPGRYVSVTGTTTITALGTIKAGTIKHVKFTGILTLTQNATSLILPGGASIVTAAGDTAILVSEGSGNWRCTNYQRANASPPTVGWETLAQGSFSAVASLDLTGASAYTRLRISLFYTASDDGVAVTFRTRTAGSVDTGGTDYDYMRIYSQAGAVGTSVSTGAGAVPLTLSNVGNAANEAMHVTINLEQLNKASYMWATFTASETASDGTRAFLNGEFRRLSTSARDGFNIAPGAGTLTGNYVVEGMRG